MVENNIHEFYMDKTLSLAKEAKDNGCLPIASIIVDKEYNILSQKKNEKVITSKQNGVSYNKSDNNIIKPDPTSHAEILAIRESCEKMNSTVLSDCTIYCSLEPCLMCISALIICRIGTIVYCIPDKFAGATNTLYNPIQDEYLNRKSINVIPNFMKDKYEYIMKEYFEMVQKADNIDLFDETFCVKCDKRQLYKRL